MISNHTPIKRQKAQKQQADNIKSWYWEQLQSNSLLRGMWNGFVTLENSLVVSYKLNVQSYNVHFKDTYTLFKIVNNLPAIQDMDLIPELGRSPGEGNGNPLQYSCLENSMDRGTWQAIQSMDSQRVRYNWVTNTHTHTHTHTHKCTLTIWLSIPTPRYLSKQSEVKMYFHTKICMWILTMNHNHPKLKTIQMSFSG